MLSKSLSCALLNKPDVMALALLGEDVKHHECCLKPAEGKRIPLATSALLQKLLRTAEQWQSPADRYLAHADLPKQVSIGRSQR